MLKSLLKIAALVLLANNAYVLHGMKEPVHLSQDKLIALYDEIVNLQKEFPGYGYDEKNQMHQVLLNSLKNVQNSGMSGPCQKMWLIDPNLFSKIFSPHNIQMFAYQQNKLGGGDPYTFMGFNRDNPYDYRVTGAPEINPLFTPINDNPFLAEYGDEQRRTLLITYYSYFFGMLENINKAIDTLSPQPNIMANLAILHTNLITAKNHYANLSAHTVGTIAEMITKEGDMRFLQLIRDSTGFAYRRNELEDSSDNVGPVVSKILKKEWVMPPTPVAVAGAQQQPTAIVPPQSGMTWWQKLAAGTGVAAAAIGTLYYKYLKTAPSTSRSWK